MKSGGGSHERCPGPVPAAREGRIAGMGKDSAGMELILRLSVSHTCYTIIIFLHCSKEEHLWRDS